MQSKETRKKVKQWNGYFRQKLKKGLSWQDIRNQLIIQKGYASRSIELLIYNYTVEAEKALRKRVAATLLACVLILVIIVPMTFIKPAITGKVIGGGNTYYVDSVSGNDADDGLSLDTPIKTITKVNTLRLYPGDSVLFKRGSVWRCPTDDYLSVYSGSTNNYITYGAYGTGSKPLFLGSYNMNGINNWTAYSGNIWVSSAEITREVGNIIFNNESSVGYFCLNLTCLDSQGDFFYNSATKKLFIYSDGNPAAYYQNIEIALSEVGLIIYFGNKKHIIFENLDLRYGCESGFYSVNGENIIIRNNSVSFIGGCILSGLNVRYGNGIQIGLNQTNITITNNRVSQVYDAAMSSQAWLGEIGVGAVLIRNIEYSYNIVTHSQYCFEYFNSNSSSDTQNLTLHHNTFAFCGTGWSGDQQLNTAYGMMGNTNPSKNTTIICKDNIIYNVTDIRPFNAHSSYEFSLGRGGNRWQGSLPITNNNLYYLGDGTYSFQINTLSYKNLSTFQIGYPQLEINSKQEDPLFVDAANGDFRPRQDSPACTMSSTGSYVGALPCAGEPAPPGPVCGDGSCVGSEDCTSCEEDCGVCVPVTFCGDNTCDVDENCSTCAADCGTCPEEQQPLPVCGDSSCNGLENCSTCVSDCGSCPVVPICGDGSCNGVENCSSCVADCGACPTPEPFCGDSVCDLSESCSTCVSDCGSCPVVPICGDGSCNGNETCFTCASDCGACPVTTPASSRGGGGGGGGGGKLTTPSNNTSNSTSKGNAAGKETTTTESVKESAVKVKLETGIDNLSSESEITLPEKQQTPGQVGLGSAKSENPKLFLTSLVAVLLCLILTVTLINKIHLPNPKALKREGQKNNIGTKASEEKADSVVITEIESDTENIVKLQNYITEAIKQGYTKEKVNSELLGAGWDENLIQHLLLMRSTEFLSEQVEKPSLEQTSEYEQRTNYSPEYAMNKFTQFENLDLKED